MTLIYLSCAWLAGIFLGSHFSLPPASLLMGLIPLPLLFLTRYRKRAVLASLCLIALASGAIYFRASLPVVDESHLRFYNDHGIVEIRGLLDSDPELRDQTARLRLSAREINLDGKWRKISGTALLTVPRYPAYSYGDVVRIKGRLETPPQLDDFDYTGYLARQGIYSTMFYPEIDILDGGQGFKPLVWVYSLRNRLSQTLAEVLPEPQASLAQGIVLGIRGNIPATVNDDFIRTGTAHLLAVSGINLSIVAGMLPGLGIWLFGKRHYIYIWLALSAIWLYALLTGMQPPVLRAVIMASLFLTAELLGRQRNAIIALLLAAAIMVGISPQVLWDASFQMSFMAMAGLIFIFPPIQTLGRKVVSARLSKDGVAVSMANFVIDSFSVSLGAVLAVWPLVAYYFGIISWAGPAATFFAMVPVPGIIITGTLAGVMGIIYLPLGQAIAWLAWLFLSYTLLVVRVFTAIPSVEQASIDAKLILIYYSVLALVIWLASNRKKLANLIPEAVNFISGLPKKWVTPPLLALAVLVSAAAATMPDDDLHINFLNVGQGDAILIQRGSQQVLIDGGPSPQAIALELSRKMPFWDRTIDLIVSTHPHADHIMGLVEVLNRYRVNQVLYIDLEYDSPLYNEWLSLIEEKNIKYTLARGGEQITLGGVVIDVLSNPMLPLSDTEPDIDDINVILRLEMGKVSFLLTADITEEAEFELIKHRAGLDSTVLKVAHHGANTATSPEFLAVVNPTVAVISVGKDNTFGHPGDEVISRLTEKLGEGHIYRTDENGTIEFTTDGERLWVRTER
ncbi:MAG: DNA internalization-related competence protein ComEC/Rec2 [Dehalococcoidales bacterium]|nr:DNA internalization-related competence protein ComEC/Rec2 [Dehalococcoidales bacterium]